QEICPARATRSARPRTNFPATAGSIGRGLLPLLIPHCQIPAARPAPPSSPFPPVPRTLAPPSPDGSALPLRVPLPVSYVARKSLATSAFLYFLTSSRRPYSSGCSTPAIASESCDHFERSLVSCFFPAAVS